MKKIHINKGPFHTKADGITFGLYTPEEIKKLSVVQVITPIAFNSLGIPLPGGLYDLAMGPDSNRGICNTCQEGFYHCPGHFGHIELPLPTINPLFSKTILSILRMSCLGCHTILIPGAIKYLAITQFKLLKSGYVQEALEAEGIVSSLMDTDKKADNKKMSELENSLAYEKFDQYTKKVFSGKEKKKIPLTRNTESLTRSLVRKISSHGKMNQKCPLCATHCKRLILSDSRILYTMGGQKEKDRLQDNLDAMEDEEEEDDDTGEPKTKRKKMVAAQKQMTPLEAKDILRKIWFKEYEFLVQYFPVLADLRIEHPTDLLFIEIIPVPPPKTRPTNFVNNQLVENPQNMAMKFVISSVVTMNYVLRGIKMGLDSLSPEAQKALKDVQGSTLQEKLEITWKNLQADVDHLMDRDRSKTLTAKQASQMIGLKQVIEKKEGLFRMNMMGKRVNFAARTVITPDPLIHIEEIGIPDEFAKVLTFPTPVTHWNVNLLRYLVQNGPKKHPGAISVENEFGQIVRLDPDNEQQRKAQADRLLVSDNLGGTFKGVKTVHRHLMNGDYLLLNRQPSLHRPSIMAHKARVLHGEKVFRLHYANCKHYNADFDGDEMNAHFPQSHVARAEAATLINVTNHYLVPKDGTPLGGLIQDHIVAAVKLTMRGRFFNRRDYQQLVYFGLCHSFAPIILEPPTIIKPRVLWSGKQVISTIVKNLIPSGREPLTFNSSVKIKHEDWRRYPARPYKAKNDPLRSDEMSESTLIFRKGELLCGVIDKINLGSTPFGLGHAFYELYGHEAVGNFLSSFSRLMTNFLNWEGFTLGIKDVLVLPEANKSRRKLMKSATKIGFKAACEGVGLAVDEIKPEDLEQALYEKLEYIHCKKDMKGRAMLDRAYKEVIDEYTNKINKACLPNGLLSHFPENNLQLLVQSGAKGSTVNTMQMSCLLGQIELEGKRPPQMISGKTLPSFRAFDISPRAGGFIDGRFLSGIRPQEFYFHCMAGREGLIDTAVKTSRSGYLQRSLIKLLEGVVTHYDMTVRDSDGSVIQFLYGEDGMDVSKSQYLKEKHIELLATNWRNIVTPKVLAQAQGLGDQKKIKKGKKKLEKWIQKNGPVGKKNFVRSSPFLKFCETFSADDNFYETGWNSETGRPNHSEILMQKWHELSTEQKDKFNKKANTCPDPLTSKFRPDGNFGVVSEKLEKIIEETKASDWKEFKDVIYYKAMRSLSAPGDPVGVLAAQSIGEPSTQMTLNTFHFAGRGEMNVTLGIPRLREILMVAAKEIKTPCMEIPFFNTVSENQAEQLRRELNRVTLDKVLHEVNVSESIDKETISRIYKLKFKFLPREEYEEDFNLKPAQILRYFEKSFLNGSLIPALVSESTGRKKNPFLSKSKKGGRENETGDGNEDQDDENLDKMNATYYKEVKEKGLGEGHKSSDEEDEAEDADMTQTRRRARHAEAEYEEPEEEEENNEDEAEEEKEMDEDYKDNNDENGTAIDDEFLSSLQKFRKESHERRTTNVCNSDPHIISYDFDVKKSLWCKISIKMGLTGNKLNLESILTGLAQRAIIHQVPLINRAFLGKDGNTQILKTEGINILAMSKYREILNLNKFYCNNIHTMASFYGIDAASKVIVKELTTVFKAYGITIDQRHFTLIADFMTFSGSYQPFNRVGIESSASPLQQMSFETVINFLRDATLGGKTDSLQSPSSRLVIGRPNNLGTGLFQCLSDFSQYKNV